MNLGLILAAGVTFIAGGVHRITGMGFALVSTPALVVLYGPREGVRLCIVLSMAAAILMLTSLWRSVAWRKAWSLIWPGLLAAPLGAGLAIVSPEPVLLVIVALAAILSLVAPRLSWLTFLVSGRHGSLVAGSSAGFLHITSGLSGPPLVSYAESEKWGRIEFVASAQIVFMAFHVATLSMRGLPQLAVPDSLYLFGALALGLGAGALGSGFIRADIARWAMFAVAWTGSIVVLARGVVMLAVGE